MNNYIDAGADEIPSQEQLQSAVMLRLIQTINKASTEELEQGAITLKALYQMNPRPEIKAALDAVQEELNRRKRNKMLLIGGGLLVGGWFLLRSKRR